MIVAKSEQVITFDCDDTLVIWDDYSFNLLGPLNPGYVEIQCPHDQLRTRHRIHKRHVAFLKKQKAKGYTVIVWSSSGTGWAEAVVKALDIVDYVDIVMSKPQKYVDDIADPNQILGKHIFLSEDGHSI